jgi:hypothetical protein
MQLAGAGLTVLHNTLLDTAGIGIAATAQGADLRGNLVDGRIRATQAMPGSGRQNLDTSALRLYLGKHPVRKLFHDAGLLDLAWRVERLPDLPRAAQQADVPDLCSPQRPASPAYGAFENFAGCLR